MRNLNRMPMAWCLAVLLCLGCSDSKFRGSGSTKDKPTPTPTDPIKACKDKADVVGVNVAFVIDNSGSNAFTDCPNQTRGPNHFTGNPQYICGGATHRETAVSDAYLALTGIANGDAASDSQLAVTSFPGDRDIYRGSEIRTQDWVAVSSQDQQGLSDSMAFTRRPIGMTPYGAGLAAAASMFDRLTDDAKPKLLIFVTDGEPTDENPTQVINQVQSELGGVKIVSVLVTQEKTREARRSDHIAYLRQQVDQNRQPRYSQTVIDQLIGGNGQKSLIESISNKVVEVPASGHLKDTFKSIIAENISCQ